MVFTTRQLSIFFLNVYFILPLELICSPLLLPYLLTGGFYILSTNYISFSGWIIITIAVAFTSYI